MAKTYKIVFSSKTAIGVALYELNAADVSRSSYEISKTDTVLYHCNGEVVNVVGETISRHVFMIEEEG